MKIGRKITVVGTGYVGLTTGACFAHLGHHVTCVDNDLQKVSRLKSGEVPIYEDGLDGLVKEGLASGRLSFTSSLQEPTASAEFVFLCLPTPSAKDGTADMTSILEVVPLIRDHLQDDAILVNKSTMPINSAHVIAELLQRPTVSVVSNPEFLREGSAVHDFLKPDRIVVGSINQDAGNRVAALYLDARCPVVVTDPISAETIKYMSNSFLAMKVSFMNEVASYCDRIGADVLEVSKGLSLDPRIGSSFLSPGPGWGGSCFPKDTLAITTTARRSGFNLSLIEAAITANKRHQETIVDLIVGCLPNPLIHSTVALLGLSFKSGTDDIRESPSLAIAGSLVERGVKVKAFDPVVPLGVTNINMFEQVRNLREALAGVDCAIVSTEWPEFASLSPGEVKSLMKGDLIFDLRYVLSRDIFSRAGLRVRSIGRGTTVGSAFLDAID